MQVKNMWIIVAVFLTGWQVFNVWSGGAAKVELSAGVYASIMFFYLSWICELLQKKGN